MKEVGFHSSALPANRKLKSEVKGKCVWTEVCNDSRYSVLHEIIHTETKPSKKSFPSCQDQDCRYFILILVRHTKDEATNIRD